MKAESSAKLYPTAVGEPVYGAPVYSGVSTAADVEAATAYASAQPIDAANTEAFQVQVPPGHGPGHEFAFSLDGRHEHKMVVPDGAGPNQVLTAMFIPRGARPGSEVIAATPEGDMAVTVPPGMHPGELLVIDVSGQEALQQYKPSCVTWLSTRCADFFSCVDVRYVPAFCFCALAIVLVVAMISHAARPRYGPAYGYGSHDGYNYGSTTPNYYQQHLLDNSGTKQGAVDSTVTLDGKLADDYPGKDEGFERGVDDKGEEIFRYEQDNQVYIIPAQQYYGWRQEHYHGSLSHDVLNLLLLSSLVHMYSRSMYFGSHMYFGAPMMPYYRSPMYSQHFGTPVMGVGGRVSYPTNAGGGVGGGARPGVGGGGPVGRAGTPVAQARPVAQGRSVGGAPVGRPVASSAYNRPTPVAQARPMGGSSWGRGGASVSRSSRGGGRGRA